MSKYSLLNNTDYHGSTRAVWHYLKISFQNRPAKNGKPKVKGAHSPFMNEPIHGMAFRHNLWQSTSCNNVA